MDGKAYDRNKIIINRVRSLCKRLNVLQMMCNVYVFKVDRRLNQHLLRSKCQGVMLKQDLNDVLPDHCFPNNGGN